MITSQDREEVKGIIKTYEKAKKVDEKTIEDLVDGFMDLAIDYEYEKSDMESEIYYYMKDLGWL